MKGFVSFCLLLCIVNSDEKLCTFILGSVADLDPGSSFFSPLDPDLEWGENPDPE
jgi:hypothetical protein